MKISALWIIAIISGTLLFGMTFAETTPPITPQQVLKNLNEGFKLQEQNAKKVQQQNAAILKKAEKSAQLINQPAASPKPEAQKTDRTIYQKQKSLSDFPYCDCDIDNTINKKAKFLLYKGLPYFRVDPPCRCIQKKESTDHSAKTKQKTTTHDNWDINY